MLAFVRNCRRGIDMIDNGIDPFFRRIENSAKSTKLNDQNNREHFYETLGTSVIYSYFHTDSGDDKHRIHFNFGRF